MNTAPAYALDQATKAQGYDELVAILTHPNWSAAERVFYATLRIEAQPTGSPERVIETTSLKAVAKATGMSVRTVQDKLGQFHETALLKYDVDRWAEDKNGNRLTRRKVNKALGDKHCCKVEIRLPDALPELVSLTDGKNAGAAKERANKDRQEFQSLKREMQAMLKEAECPDCHSKGTIRVDLHGVCTDCGTLFTEAQVEFLARIPNESAEISKTQTLPGVDIDPADDFSTAGEADPPTQNAKFAAPSYSKTQSLPFIRGEALRGGGWSGAPPSGRIE